MSLTGEDKMSDLGEQLYDSMPAMISAILIENEIDPRLYAEKWASCITIKSDCCNICTGSTLTLTGEDCICGTGTIHGELDGLRRLLQESLSG